MEESSTYFGKRNARIKGVISLQGEREREERERSKQQMHNDSDII